MVAAVTTVEVAVTTAEVAVTVAEVAGTVTGAAAADTVEAVEATVDATATLPRNERATGENIFFFGGGVGEGGGCNGCCGFSSGLLKKKNKTKGRKQKIPSSLPPLDWLDVSLKSALLSRLP